MPRTSRLAAVVAAVAVVALAGMIATQRRIVGGTDGPAGERRFGDVDLERLLRAGEHPGDWLTLGRDLAQTFHSPLDLISDDNVRHLGFAWEFATGTTNGLEATPIVVDGVLYASGPWGVAWALDAATGAELWRFDPRVPPDWGRRACCDIVNRGLAVWHGKVYVASLDGRLFALDAATGDVVWEADTFVDRDRFYTITGAPYIAGDVVVIGNSGGEFNARGYITAYDTETGEQRWRFWTVPGDPSRPFEHPELEMAAATWDPNSLWEVGGGGTVWDGMAWDPELDLLYVGTGNSTPYPRKHRSPAGGDNLFLASILAIEPATGRLRWHYQEVPAENWDYTAVQKMILADLTLDGRARKVLLHAPKNGFFYVLDRETGELLSAEPYVPVNWASRIDLASGRPVETEQAEYFDEPKLIFPSEAGGHNWHPMAYNPATGLVYIPAIEAPMVFANMFPDTAFAYDPGGLNLGAAAFFPAGGAVDTTGFGHLGIPSLEELARAQPDPRPRGVLRAWDPVAQRSVWEVDTSGPWHGEPPATWNGGGVITTAGNLVLQGRATGELYAYAADTGELLHTVDVGTSIIAAPTTYTVDGIQYVAVLAGFGGALGNGYFPEGTAAWARGNAGRIVAFRLGGGPVPRPPLLDRSARIPEPPPSSGTPEQVARGATLFAGTCARCHANAGPSVIPDLRYMAPETHAEFADIVLRGARQSRGMASFGDVLDEADAAAIHVYLVDLAWRGWRDQQAGRPADAGRATMH